MPWRTGGVIGQRNLPGGLSASGVWRLSEIESAKRGDAWPAAEIALPSDLAGLVLWLDGADETTLYDATTGGSLVAADGGVARWQDKSGNNRHFIQTLSDRRPTRLLDAKNGLAAIGFANDWLTGTYTYAIGSVFCLWSHPTTVAGDNFAAIMSQRTASSQKTGNGTMGFNLAVQNFDPSRVNIDPSPAPGSYRLNGATAAAGLTTPAGNSSGALVRTSPDRWQHLSATFSPRSGSHAFALGGDTLVASTRLMQNGYIGEIIAYSGTLTLGQAVSVEKYLTRKWGLE